MGLSLWPAVRNMNKSDLVVEFTVAGDGRLHVRRAARIKVDGRGGLLLYDSHGGAMQSIELGTVQSLHLQQVRYAGAELATPGFVR